MLSLGALIGLGLAVALVFTVGADDRAPEAMAGGSLSVASVRSPEAPGLHTTDAGPQTERSLLATLRSDIAAGADALARLRKLAETEPAQAIEFALVLGRNGEERDQWVTELTRTWALREPQTAWDWLGRQTARLDQLANGSLIGVVLEAMAERSPQLVFENVDALLRRGDVAGILPPLVACQHGLNALLACGHLNLARAAVEEWARNPRTLEVGASAYNVVAGAIGEHSWTVAGAWLATLPPSSNRTVAFAALASKWGDQDPTAALAWAESLAPANEPFTVMHTVFSDWAERDGRQAADWLSGYVQRAQSDTEIDQLIGSLVTFTIDLRRDPHQALSWVGMMRDAAQRTSLAERVAIRWGRGDLAGASAFVEQSNAFTPAQKVALRQRLIEQATDPEPIDD